MQRILLLGAGFSRNWGGWLASEAFEYLLGCQEILQNQYLRDLLWENQSIGGFESALAELQTKCKQDPKAQDHLEKLQNAVIRMFDDMNKGFNIYSDWVFQKSEGRTVPEFLFKFDAIFTLNQDLLLEYFYLNAFDTTARKWNGDLWGQPQLPGMVPIGSTEFLKDSWAKRDWEPSGNHKLDPKLQPYFKLHGSSNWRNPNGGSMLIMGGNKAHEIGLSPVLQWYHQQFKERLSTPSTRLMVIGYGFRDDHINAAITDAIKQHDLKMFIIDPNGAELAMSLNRTRGGGMVIAPTQLEGAFQQSLIGASRRLLREIFGSNMIEHAKVMRFFQE